MNGQFRAGTYHIPLKNTVIMGILNVTPDSFSDGGKFFSPDQAVKRALELEAQGAEILDLGGQSTRPGFEKIPWEMEWQRLEPVLSQVVKEVQVPISVDTFYPQVARRALEAGASMLNDVTGFSREMAEVAKASQCGLIVMHAAPPLPPDELPTRDICQEVGGFFREKLDFLRELGIDQARICFDPGIGFGKTYEENLQLLAQVGSYRVPGVPLLMAASRKRVVGQPCGNPPFVQRLPATLAAHTCAVLAGADLLRVHDVAEALQGAQMADALRPYFSLIEESKRYFI